MARYGRASHGSGTSTSGGSLRLIVVPPSPSIPSTTPLGAKVAGLQGQWSNGAPFTGSYVFVSPNFDDGGVYSVTVNADFTGNLLINPAGPGVGAAGGSIEHVTLEATQ